LLGDVEKYQQQVQHQPESVERENRHQLAVRRTTMMTTLSVPRSTPQPPIIVLHEAPVIPPRQRDDQLPVTPRQRRQARRFSTSTTAQTLPEVLLSPGVLETIVIHNGSLDVNSSSSGRSRSGSSVSASASADSCRARQASMTTLHH